MNFVPVQDFDDRMWYEAYLTVYNKDLAFHMGVDPSLIANPPSLVEFYENITSKVENGTAMAWGVTRKGEYQGHVILDKSTGEWEIGTVLKNRDAWGSGMGVKATLHGLKWIFEDQGSEWAIAWTRGRDPKVPEMLKRGGFRPFMDFLVMDKPTWNERWHGRV